MFLTCDGPVFSEEIKVKKSNNSTKLTEKKLVNELRVRCIRQYKGMKLKQHRIIDANSDCRDDANDRRRSGHRIAGITNWVNGSH